ncbi:TPA: phage tail tape measure protein [Yersinia enterocolitica]|uniref:phage tail tape measure protein n=1 Tax=Yersinia enterocolitica TaxID=630 RepID=UPI00227A073A|nr:phage tail tape measure protein [Yersinia enterocolitica]MCY1685379.1 phage tail tape measure protein [Yersinia enterocolitica]HEN3251546.1 phage tail tape measure protein [Yersinia enterocolitica]
MSNNLKLQVLLSAVDRASRPFKAIQAASKSLSGDIRHTQKILKNLNAQAGQIEGFRKTSAQLAVTHQALKQAKQQAAELAIQFRNTEKPTRAQAQVMEAAKRAASELQLNYNGLRLSVQRQRQALQQAGINTRTLSHEQRRLKASINETTTSLNRQREALARNSQQQAKLNRINQRYQSGKAVAGNLAGTAAAGVGAATSGAVTGAAVLKPGYDFAQKNSELQAVLGLAKNSADMQVLRTQARQLGDTTAASADDAAAAQIIIAKSGADKDGILAATPVTLNMSLANQKSMEENATLLMGVKSAFGLSNDKTAHIGDVISAAMNQTAANFAGLSDTLTYAAPVAKNAGISVEETAAMAGALADAKITGSMAGTGSRAVITRLQAPVGKAHDALDELGVNTADRKGNMRPLFTLLKEMQNSFEKNKLGTAQRAEYMKAIFGEEASSAAAVLMEGAASGKLDRLTTMFQASDGKTAELVNIMQDNLGGDFKALQSAYAAVGTDLFDQQESSLRKLTQTTTHYVLQLDQWVQKNKGLSAGILKIVGVGVAVIGVLGAVGLVAWPVVMGINAIIAGASLLGTVFTAVAGGIITAIGALTWPIVGIAVAIVAGALLIRQYWQPISAFFTGVVEGLKAVFAPLAELFAPLQPVFDWLGEKLQAAWHGFSELIAPVKSTQQSLDSCRNAGLEFGRALADALTAPLRIFNKLRAGVDWLLEKLGLIKSESADIEVNASKVNTGGYSPSGGLLTANYAPVTANGGDYTDQSQNHYQLDIAIPPDQNREDTKNMIREVLEEKERQRRAAARSRMNTD